MKNPRVLGTGSYLPERIVTNQELVDDGLPTSDDWIVSHTGIRCRHVVADDQATSDLATAAAQRALTSAEVEPSALSAIVCATSSPDHGLPATANLVQANLGASCGAIDVNAGCSGFVHALLVGHALCAQNGGAPVLVVGADAYSRIMNWSDRTTAVFFGDGAGAAVVGAGEGGPSLLASLSGSDGSGGHHIQLEAGGSRRPVTPKDVAEHRHQLRMNGRAVWDFAVARVPGVVREVVARAGLTLDDVDLIVPHQSNARMLSAFGDALGGCHDRIYSHVDAHANTAAASVAIALDAALHEGRVQRGKVVVLVGFGAGLSWCAACLRW